MAKTTPELAMLEAGIATLRARIEAGQDATREAMACDRMARLGVQVVANADSPDRVRLGRLQLTKMQDELDALAASAMPNPDKAGTLVLVMRDGGPGYPAETLGLFRTLADREPGTLAKELAAAENTERPDDWVPDAMDGLLAHGPLDPVPYVVVTLTNPEEADDFQSMAVTKRGTHG